MSNVYLLDSSFLINGWTKRYRRTVFPTIWSKLETLVDRGTVISCFAVFEEIEKGADDLLEWCKHRKSMFHRPTEEELLQVREVMKQFPNFAALGGASNKADPFVIAHAKTHRAIVVTDEISQVVKATKPPKIPTVCEALEIPWMSPMDFLEEIGVRL